ncbi:hypothetical protein J1N35_026727 [Gossypium stocksii]|uniref:CASP-like protein n=1 Tax=Gossypium stocksii TaxID=47602 RepID=A0A9D3V8E0_9ROSI|nr:hypothetical protein J1N35_026727 [Gossypium stocksii]
MKGIAGESGETSNGATPVNSNINRVAILEFILRFLAAGGTLESAMAMGTTEETVPLFPQSILLNAKYSDLPMFTFFVIANLVTCAYLVFSLPLSFYYIIRRAAKHSRIVLVTFDTLDSFCERTFGSLISSFASAFLLMLIIISSAIAISLS